MVQCYACSIRLLTLLTFTIAYRCSPNHDIKISGTITLPSCGPTFLLSWESTKYTYRESEDALLELYNFGCVSALHISAFFDTLRIVCANSAATVRDITCLFRSEPNPQLRLVIGPGMLQYSPHSRSDRTRYRNDNRTHRVECTSRRDSCNHVVGKRGHIGHR